MCSFPFCKYKLMKLKLSVEKLRLFIIFEILFENTEKKTTKCNYMQKPEMFFFHFFQNFQKLLCIYMQILSKFE